MYDLVASCSAGKIEGHTVLDIAGKEDTEGELDLPVAYYPRRNLITLLQMDGVASKEEVKRIVELAIRGCEKVYEVQRKALKHKYDFQEVREILDTSDEMNMDMEADGND
jgi:exosome complex component RRP41